MIKFAVKVWLAVFGNIPAFITTLLGFLTLLVPVMSIEQAQWISPQPSIVTVLVLAYLVGALLANKRLPKKLVIPLILVTGFLVMFWQTVRLFSPAENNSAVQLWWQTVSNYRPNEGTIYFAFFLVLSTWLLSSFSLWFLLRHRNAWFCIISGAVMLLVNLANLPREYYYFLLLFIMPAVVLLGASHLTGRSSFSFKWQEKNVRYGTLLFSIAVITIAVTTAVTAYFVPAPAIENLGLTLDTSAVNADKIQDTWFNIFSSVGSKWNIARSTESQKLLFKDSLDNNNNIYYVIISESSDYWCTRRFDVYNSWGWTSTTDTGNYLPAGEPLGNPDKPSNSRTLTYTVENRSKTDIILLKGDIVSLSLEAKLMYFRDTSGEPANTSWEIASVAANKFMSPYESYRVKTSITDMTPSQMAAAGDRYPDWVTSRYLQLPESLPVRVAVLSQQITSDAQTPYEKILAIKDYLQNLTYDPAAPPIPEKEDGVDYFLFTSKRGVCTNFASAMVVMLRSAGVPSRLGTGYLSGELDKTTGKYVIRGRNTHAWAEVYFPNFGWINIESTPSGTSPDTEGAVTDTDTVVSFTQGSPLPWWMVTTTPALPDTATDTNTPHKTLPWPYFYAILGIVALFSVLYIGRAFFNRWVNDYRNIETAAGAYDRMCHLAYLGKSGPVGSETPLEFSHRLAAALPAEKEDINTIVAFYLNTRYSPRRNIGEGERVKLQTAWVRLCRALLQHMLRLKRWVPIRFLLLKWLE